MTKLLKATHEGTLKIGDKELRCAVLTDGTRVISRNAIFRAFGRTKRGRAKSEQREPNMPSFLDAKNLQPFIGADLRAVLKPIEYLDKKGKPMTGYDSVVIPLVCDSYLAAREADALKEAQKPLAKTSEMLDAIFFSRKLLINLYNVHGTGLSLGVATQRIGQSFCYVKK